MKESEEKAREFAYNLVADFVYNGYGDASVTSKEITDKVAMGLVQYANQDKLRESAEKFLQVHDSREDYKNWTKWSDKMEESLNNMRKALK